MTNMRHIRTYVITADKGSAPNFDPPAVTLVICAPDIRRIAQQGDLVLAFNGRFVEDREGRFRFASSDSVRWAGTVGNVTPMRDYWEDARLNSKKAGLTPTPDNIYHWRDGRYVQVKNPVHDQRDIRNDVRGENAIVFQRTWYFGRTAPLLPDKFGLAMRARRRQRSTPDNRGLFDRVVSWLDQQDVVPYPDLESDSSSRGCDRPTNPSIRGRGRCGC